MARIIIQKKETRLPNGTIIGNSSQKTKGYVSIPIRLEKYNPEQVFNLIESHKNDIAIRNDLKSHNIHAAYDKCEGNLDFLKSHIKSSSAPDIPNQNGKYKYKNELL